jgi:integrase-like protein
MLGPLASRYTVFSTTSEPTANSLPTEDFQISSRVELAWHTFRHSLSTMLVEDGENLKVVQELMRHANCRCTLEIYSQAQTQAKREAQHRVIEIISPRRNGLGINSARRYLGNGP